MNFTVQGSGTTEPSRAVPGYLEGSEWRNCLFVNCGKGLALWEFNDYVFTNVTRHLLNNWYIGVRTQEPVPNVIHANSARLAAQALDDFRELGALDLQLNHAEK